MDDQAPSNMSPEVAKRRRMAELWMDAQPTVLSYILASMPRIHDAEDLLQQVAVDVATNFELYDEKRPFVAWAVGIARNKLRAHFRKQGSDRLVFSDATLDALGSAYADTHADARGELDALQHCMDQLTDRPRRLLQLRYHEHLSAPEIAERMQSTSGSVRVMLTRVRSQLAECIQRTTGATAAERIGRGPAR